MLLATFDIFDTALLRICGRPEAVFELMAQRLWPDDESLRTAFLNRRRQAGASAGPDASVSDIYSLFGEYEFSPLSRKDLLQAELDEESRMLTANAAIRENIEKLRNDGFTIKFLSDMYLPSLFLKDVLQREGCLKRDEEVIVSCEWRARKDNGSLYKKVRDKYNPSKWVHYGDNLRSDYKMARKNHVEAVKVDTRFTSIECRINSLGMNMRYSSMASLAAGVMRVSRINCGDSPSARLAADYVGALYLPFVAYVLRMAHKDGIKRLHFLSRDGYIMQKIVESLIYDGIELNYLFVSRRSLIWAYMQEDSEKRYVETTDRKHLLMRSVDSLLDRLQTSREEIQRECGVSFDYDKILSIERQKEFLDTLFHHPTVTPWLETRIRKNSKLTKAYLIQEGFVDGTKQAMVDIGWLGTTRLMINSVLGLDNEKSETLTIPTFYIGVRADVFPRNYGNYYSFFPQGTLDTTSTGLIENYYSASPYPTTIGYAMSDDKIIPTFPEGTSFSESKVIKSNVEVCKMMCELLRDYIDSMSEDFLYQWAKTSIESISKLQDDVNLTPLLTSVEFDGVPMASRLSLPQLFKITVLGDRHTAFDRGSVYLTAGKKVGKVLWRVHEITARLRGVIYKKFILKNDQDSHNTSQL